MASSSSSSGSRSFTLLSTDGKSFEVEESVASQSDFLKQIMEECSSNLIPLLNINRKILEKVIDYCKKHVEVNDPEKKKKEKSVEGEEEEDLKKWNAEFLNVNLLDLDGLLKASQYLGIKNLTNLTVEKMEDKMKENPMDRLREMLDIMKEYPMDKLLEIFTVQDKSTEEDEHKKKIKEEHPKEENP